MKKHICLTYLIFFFLIGLHAAAASIRTTVTLRWDRNPEPNITGYRVYWGQTSGAYTPLQNVSGTTTTVAVPNNGTFYFVVTALNSAGLESPFSNKVRWP